MSKADGLIREIDRTKYVLCIEHVPGKKRPVLMTKIDNEYSAVRLKVAEVTDDDTLQEVMQGMFGGDWK